MCIRDSDSRHYMLKIVECGTILVRILPALRYSDFLQYCKCNDKGYRTLSRNNVFTNYKEVIRDMKMFAKMQKNKEKKMYLRLLAKKIISVRSYPQAFNILYRFKIYFF